MSVAYQVAVQVTARDEASKVLGSVAKQLALIDELLTRVTKGFAAFGAASKHVRKVDDAIGLTAGSIGRMNRGIGTANREMANLSRAADRAARSAREMRTAMNGAGGSGGSGSGGSGGHGGGGHGAGMMGGEILSRWGEAGLGFVERAVEHSTNFAQEAFRLRAMQIDKIEAGAEARIIKYAQSASLPGMDSTEALKMSKEIIAITGHPGEVEQLAPFLARMKFGISTLYGAETATQNDRLVMDVLKTAELRGSLKDQKSFMEAVNYITQANIASGGLIQPREFVNALKTGGTSVKALSNEAFYRQSLHTIEEMGGFRFGTGSQGAYQQWQLGRMPKKVQEELYRDGLLDNAHIILKNGKFHALDETAIKNPALMMRSGYEHFKQEVLPPILKKLGLEGKTVRDVTGDQSNAVDREIAKKFGNRAAAAYYSTMWREGPNIDRVAELAGNSMNAEQLGKAAMETPAGKHAQMMARLDTVLTTLGDTVLPLAVQVMTDLTSFFEKANSFAKEHSGLIEFAMNFLLSTSIISTVIGNVVVFIAELGILGAMFMAGGALGGAIAFAGIAVGILAYKIYEHWDLIKETAGQVWAWVGEKWAGIIDSVSRLFDTLDKGFSSWPNFIEMIKGFFESIGSGISRVFSWGSGGGTSAGDGSVGGALDQAFGSGGAGAGGGLDPAWLPGGKGSITLPGMSGPIKPGEAISLPKWPADKVSSAGDVYLDSKKVGDILFAPLAAAASHGQGVSGYDSTMTPALALAG